MVATDVLRWRVRVAAVLLAAAVGGAATAGWSAGVFAAEEEVVGEVSAEQGASLGQLMAQMSDDFRRLKRTVRDESQREEALSAVMAMQRAALAARLKEPTLVDVPEAEKQASLLDYRVRMIALSQTLLETEQAVLEGRTSDAFDAVKAMAIIQREGHEKFRVDE